MKGMKLIKLVIINYLSAYCVGKALVKGGLEDKTAGLLKH